MTEAETKLYQFKADPIGGMCNEDFSEPLESLGCRMRKDLADRLSKSCHFYYMTHRIVPQQPPLNNSKFKNKIFGDVKESH